MLIEYRVGSESHSSAWGKFYVKGLEQWEVKEGGSRDRHESYTELAAEVPEGTIFTIFSQSGNKRGTEDFDFYICETQEVPEPQKITGGCYGRGGWCSGNYYVLCHGEGTTKAPRLLNWWTVLSVKCAEFLTEDGKLKKGTKKLFAAWCKQHLDIRGLKDLPSMPINYTPEKEVA